MPKAKRIVTRYARMGPREVFDIRRNGDFLEKVKAELEKPGVYVLYKDEEPHYIGKTGGSLGGRIHDHTKSTDKLYNFWNHFSAFEIVTEGDRDVIEAVLIASMPTANSANPKFAPIGLPKEVTDVLSKRRQIDVDQPRLTTKA
jgi:hypothetical protein